VLESPLRVPSWTRGSKTCWRPTLVPSLALALAVLLPGCSIRIDGRQQDRDALAETGFQLRVGTRTPSSSGRRPLRPQDHGGLLESAPNTRACSSPRPPASCSTPTAGADGRRHDRATDLARATELRERARKLYLGPRLTGLRGLEVDFPGLGGPSPATARHPREDEEGARAAALLDGHWDGRRDVAQGERLRGERRPADRGGPRPAGPSSSTRAGASASIQEFFVNWESARSTIGGSIDRAREHFEKDLECARGPPRLPLRRLRRERERGEAGQGPVPGDDGEGAGDRREPPDDQRLAKPPRPEARPLAASGASTKLFIE